MWRQQRGVQLAAVRRDARLLEQRPEVEGKDVHDLHPGLRHQQGAQRFLVRLVTLGGDEHELPDAAPQLPRLDQLVHQPVQRLAAERRTARQRPVRIPVGGVFDRRGPQDAEARGQIVGEPLDEDRVDAQRQVRAVLFGRPDGDDQRRPPSKAAGHLGRDQFLEPPGRSRTHPAYNTRVNRSPLPWWLAGVALSVIAAGEWLRTPTTPWMVLLSAGAVAALVGLRPWTGWRVRALGATVALLALAPPLTDWRLGQLEADWPAIQGARVERATDRLAGDLHAAYLLASRLADDATAAPTNREGLFAALDRAVSGAPLEAGVAVLDESGAVQAWAGSHRLAPRGDGRPVSTTSNPFYLVLEVTRDAPAERRAVGSVVVWASSAVPERVQSVTEDFRARTGVGLRVYPAGTAPDHPDVFDYSEPTTAGPRLLFSVEPVPPELAEATASTRAIGARATAWLLLLTLILTVVAAGPCRRQVRRADSRRRAHGPGARRRRRGTRSVLLADGFFPAGARADGELGRRARHALAPAHAPGGRALEPPTPTPMVLLPPRRPAPARSPGAAPVSRPGYHAAAERRVARSLARLATRARPRRDGARRARRRVLPRRAVAAGAPDPDLAGRGPGPGHRRCRAVRLAAGGPWVGQLVHLPLAARPACW